MKLDNASVTVTIHGIVCRTNKLQILILFFHWEDLALGFSQVSDAKNTKKKAFFSPILQTGSDLMASGKVTLYHTI